MLKQTFLIVTLAFSLGFAQTDKEQALDSQDQGLIEAENAYQAALEKMQAEELEKIRQKNIGASYLEKVQRRYISHMPYVMLSLLIVPVIKKHDVVGYLTVMPEVRGKDVDSYRKIVKELVPLRDAIFCDLFNALNRLWVGPEPPSADIVAGRIKKCVSSVCKSDVAERVTLHILNFNITVQVQNY